MKLAQLRYVAAIADQGSLRAAARHLGVAQPAFSRSIAELERELGAALFELIKVHFLTELIKKPWFAIPATVMACTSAIHVTDVRAGIVRGARTLKLTLLSWLLPLMVLITGAFLAALLFTGLEPLWSTRRATAR